MATHPDVAPVLSTPDTHILNELESIPQVQSISRLSDEAFSIRYEVERTIGEIRENRWHRIALQFPDEMLSDSTRVFQLLARRLQSSPRPNGKAASEGSSETDGLEQTTQTPADAKVKLTILADTSYGSCCVDEIAAEHVNADAVVHYGRACLSPTARLPVLHIFTTRDVDIDAVIKSFRETFPDLEARILLTGDMPFEHQVPAICSALVAKGYENIYATSIIHNPSSVIPNRTVPLDVADDPDKLQEWSLFHIGPPPTALLLTLASRVPKVHIYSTDSCRPSGVSRTIEASTALILRRRYALVTSLATVPIWGILINTLSVKNYLKAVDHVKAKITAAGKKSYLFVVGKLNAAKVANFSEIGGWVVIGCWETSLVDSKDFYRPVITPFELDLALKNDQERLWTGEWRADFNGLIDRFLQEDGRLTSQLDRKGDDLDGEEQGSEGESTPPEFDLRTGQYVSQSRPMHRIHRSDETTARLGNGSSTALTRRPKADLISVNGVASPAADYLRTKRTWRGLGGDLEAKEEAVQESSAIEEGRSGVARGYVVGESPLH